MKTLTSNIAYLKIIKSNEKLLIVRKESVDRLKGDASNPAENFVSSEIVDFYIAILKGYVI